MKKDKSMFKMTEEELEQFLKIRRKAHAIDTDKKYHRNKKHKKDLRESEG